MRRKFHIFYGEKDYSENSENLWDEINVKISQARVFCTSVLISVCPWFFLAKLTDIVIDSLRRAHTAPIIAANQLTSCRVAVNSFQHSSLRNWTIRHRVEVCISFRTVFLV